MSIHFLIPILISVLIVSCFFCYKDYLVKKIGFGWWIHLMGAVAIYGVIVWCAWWTGYMYELRLADFDLNNDGVFSSSEITKEMKIAQKRLANDTARNFAPITGIIGSIIITFIMFLIDVVRIQVWNKILK